MERINDLIKEEKLDEALKNIIITLDTAAIRHKPRKDKRWFDRNCYEARKKTLHALHHAKTSNLKEDILKYSEERKKYKDLLKQAKSEYTEREAREAAEEATKNPFLAQNRFTTTPANGIHIQDWEQHFEQLLNRKKLRTAIPIMDSKEEVPDQTPRIITKEEVREAIARLKNKRACGPDGVYNEHLK